MEEQILKEMLVELKGLRSEAVETKKEIQSLKKSSDETNKRLDITNDRLDGLHQSFVVLQQGFADMRYDLQGIKEFLSQRVIWSNDSIKIDTESGGSIHGTIHKESK